MLPVKMQAYIIAITYWFKSFFFNDAMTSLKIIITELQVDTMLERRCSAIVSDV